MKNQRKHIGKVTSAERDEIRNLFERQNALKELIKVLPDMNKKEADILYDKIVKDLGQATTKFNEWWKNMSEKYKWENTNGKQWEIDFDTCDIFIKKTK